jgi:hypothetical protein
MIPSVSVAERVVIEMISTQLVPARKPVVSTDVALPEMSSAVVDAGKMTSADVTTPEVSTAMATATPVSTTMTACGVATAMTTTAMTTTAMAAATMSASVGRQSQRPKRNGHRQNPHQLGFHRVLPLRAPSETSTRKRSNCNIVARIRPSAVALWARSSCAGLDNKWIELHRLAHETRSLRSAMSTFGGKADIGRPQRNVRL